jgi:hypothetical protein
MSRRLFTVEVTHKIFVTAHTAEEAAKWAEYNVTEWSSDAPDDVHATPVRRHDTFTPEIHASLPWAASGLSEEESDKTVQWWIDRAKREGI